MTDDTYARKRRSHHKQVHVLHCPRECGVRYTEAFATRMGTTPEALMEEHLRRIHGEGRGATCAPHV